MNFASAGILVVRAVIGAASVAEYITEKLFGSADSALIVFVAPVGNNAETAEQLLRGAASKLSSRRFRRSYAVCLDCGMDDETRKICEQICEDCGNIRLMTKQEFARKFEICQNR